MVDERIRRVAELLIDYSTRVKSGDRVLIAADLLAQDLALEVYRHALVRGANPWIRVDLPGRQYIFFKHANDAQLKFFPEHEMDEIKKTDVYVLLRAPLNVKELSSIDPDKISARMRVLAPIRDWRVEKTRWTLFYYPTEGLAQEAEMSLPEFEDFVFNSCLIDWGEISGTLAKLKRVVDATNRVRIVSPDTELEFSVGGRSAVVADGRHNMPDGELFTSVVEDSTRGHMQFDIPAVWSGNVVEGVTLTFDGGAVVDAKATKNETFLNKIIGTDEGAKRIGEFGMGLNYGITKPVKAILFDEKIGGSIHLALGRGYKETLSQNESAIHWDLIKDLRKGGEIYFDGKLVMKDGKWLLE
ncbi:MAG: Thermophilic metalloprotease (M29) [Candidatus Bathyarchaeota archaeon BA1]|nr:MAG: Thermophilic metalloprotease (M29) [Candidatus Bathyarchaeota archaeon BA1]